MSIMASNVSTTQKIGTMNEKSVKPLKVRFCPECKSTDVKFVFHLQNLFGMLPRVECTDCKFHAHEFPLLVVDKKKLQCKGKKSKTVNRRKKT